MQKAGFRPATRSSSRRRRSTRRTAPTRREPKRELSLPEPRVLARIKDAWRDDRKPANIMLVFDTSGSMGDENKLDQAKAGPARFFRQLAPRDRVGLISFSDKVTAVRRRWPGLAEPRGAWPRIHGLFADGGTAIYDATRGGYEAVRALNDDLAHQRRRAADRRPRTRLSGSSRRSRKSSRNCGASRPCGERHRPGLHDRLRRPGRQRRRLKAIAAATGGQEFTGDPGGWRGVYQSISSLF